MGIPYTFLLGECFCSDQAFVCCFVLIWLSVVAKEMLGGKGKDLQATNLGAEDYQW